MVGEQSPVAEILLGVRRRLEDATELVVLFQPVARSPRESTDRAEFFRSRRLSLNGERERHYLYPRLPTRAA
jgi:hypothetical protein